MTEAKEEYWAGSQGEQPAGDVWLISFILSALVTGLTMLVAAGMQRLRGRHKLVKEKADARR